MADIPEYVRDARWEADFEPNPYVPYQTTNTLFAGTRLVRQEVWIRQKRLGHGGFGMVWLEKAHPNSPSPTRVRAVKELRIGHKAIRRRECIRELYALVKFSQQKFVGSFVEFYNWYESNDTLFIAMEYCRHGDLTQFVQDHGAIVEAEVQQIAGQILEGLMFMHENNFAHRDLKPANILIQHRPPDNDWKIKIGDMGLSKRIDIESVSTTIRGTPGFIPPERVPGIGVDPSATEPFPCDMWCFGEVVFFLLTSEKTFDSSTQLQRYYNGTQSFPEERLRTAKISQQAIDFIKALMAAEPCERLSAFQADDHSWTRDSGISSMPGPHHRVSKESPDFFCSSSSQSKGSAVGENHEKLGDNPLDEFTARSANMPDLSHHATATQSVPSGSWDASVVHIPLRSPVELTLEQSDLRKGTTSIAPGTWSSSTMLPAPGFGSSESVVTTPAGYFSQTSVHKKEEEDESSEEERKSTNVEWGSADEEEDSRAEKKRHDDTRPNFRFNPVGRISTECDRCFREIKGPALAAYDYWQRNARNLPTTHWGRQTRKRTRYNRTIGPTAADSSVLSALTPADRSYDSNSSDSDSSRASINNPRLLETVEDAIRKLILPKLDALKRERN